MTHRRTDRPFRGDERIAAREKAAALYRAGHTIGCVATQIDRPYSTTRSLLADADVAFRPRGRSSRCTAPHSPVGSTVPS
ncbi:helix-turn-helix domain-containing protein [Streptomyces sp. NPDC088353]|uniref:helix-turn-helix domain-containing protein n=1 Tax=Streptomyces sp. NPDC088353 TaxID=3365855 RepID=UPI0037F9D904